MAKANLTLANGTKATFQGSPEEVAKLITLLSGSQAQSLTEPAVRAGHSKTKGGVRSPGSGRKPSGQTGLITELKEEGFFKIKRSIADIQKKLEEGGHIYAQTSLSMPLTRLTRARVLGRIKENGVWKYVNR